MFYYPTILTIIVVMCTFTNAASVNDTRTLPDANALGSLAQAIFQQSAALPSAPNVDFLAQFGSFVGLLSNISQPFIRPQPENSVDSAGSVVDAPQQPVLRSNRPSISSVLKPIYTTLPFNNLNLTEFSWIENGTIEDQSIHNEGPRNEKEAIKQETKFFGGRNTTYADLNFLTVPQILGLFGR